MKTRKLEPDYHYVALELLYRERSAAAKRFYRKQQQGRKSS